MVISAPDQRISITPELVIFNSKLFLLTGSPSRSTSYQPYVMLVALPRE